MDKKPPTSGSRQLAYNLAPETRGPTASWISNVTQFYASVLRDLDGLTYLNFSADTYVSRLRKPEETVDDADPANTGPVMITSNEGIESLAVHFVVQLTSLLGHVNTQIRLGAVSLVFQLACVLDKSIPEKKLEGLLVAFESDEHGYQDPVHEMFKSTGKAFSIMVIAFVAGLECFNSSLDWRIRGTCNAALARLVFENDRIFLQEDHLAAIWNLYFSLSSIPLISNVFPDRLVIIKALHLLAPLYTTEDVTLSISVADVLLRLKDKTASELEAIKATLIVILERICGKRPASASTTAAKSVAASVSSTSSSGHDNEAGYEMFLNLITPHDEYAYDLLAWAYETFTLNMYASVTGAGKTLPINWFPALNEFIISISNHFRATPPLVRYGSAVALHTTLHVCPTFPNDNRQIWIFLIAGVLDADYLTAFLYLSMIEKIEMPESAEVRRIVSKLLRTDARGLSYDELYAGKSSSDTKEATRSDILDVIVKQSPAIAPILLHKMANSLDYLPLQSKLRQLRLIRVWAKKMDKLDTFLMQLLVPLCESHDESVQLETIRVIQALIPSFTSATQSDITFVWTHLSALMTPKSNTALLMAVLNLIKSFPMAKLSSVSREELLVRLFKNVFHKDPVVRHLVYTLIGASGDFWKISGQTSAALGVLLLSLGDDNIVNAKCVVDQIISLGSPMLSQVFVQLSGLRDTLGKPLADVIKSYDALATTLAMHKADYRPIIEAMIHYDRVDEFWKFYLQDVPDNQLARPDDYPFSRNFIQNPMWISLLLCKFSVPPPSLTLDAASRRDVMPTTPAGKRRFICGFLHCLLPTMGITDPAYRYAACLTVIRCCFKGVNGHTGMLRGVLEYTTQQMLPNKHWSYQLSALDLLGLIVRLKIPGVAESVLQQYLDLAMDFLQNSPTEIVKIGVLNFLEILMLVFPKAIQSKLQEIRDCTRTLLVDKDQDLVKTASRIYPLIFRIVGRGTSTNFEDFLQNELAGLALLTYEGIGGDPLTSNLNKDESNRVKNLSIVSMGMILDTATPSYKTAQTLFRYIAQANAEMRASALTAIFNLIQGMDPVESSAVTWMLMPLYADPSKMVRLLFIKFLKNVPNSVETRCASLPTHPEDMLVLPLTSWEELLTDTASIAVNQKHLVDMMSTIENLNPYPTIELTIEDDCFHLPTVSEKLMAKFKALAQATTTLVPPSAQVEVIYCLNEFRKIPILQPFAMLVLSEFCSLHEPTIQEVGETFVNSLSQDVRSDNNNLIESCMVGLKNLAETSPGVFKQLINKMIAPAVPNEGDLLALLYLVDAIKDVAANKAPEMLQKYVPLIASTKYPLKKRLYASFLAVDLSLIAGQEEMKNVLDGINTLLEGITDPSTKEQVHRAAGRIMTEMGSKHPLFKNMAAQTRADLKSSDIQKRLQALSTFRVFCKHMSNEENMWFVLQFLADSSPEIRGRAQVVMVQDKVLEYAYTALQKTSPKTGQRAAILKSCRLSTMNDVGFSSLSSEESEMKQDVKLDSEDPYNTKFFDTERRKKYSKLFGVVESVFAKATLPLTQAVIKSVENRAANVIQVSTESTSKVQWFMDLDTITILHELIQLNQAPASDLIEKLFSEIESAIKPKNETNSTEDVDVAYITHRVDVLSSLMFAHDGIGQKVPAWLKRFQGIIQYCTRLSNSIRESLYNDLEKTFYFFNEYVDIPIVSDEQYELLEQLKEASQDATLEIVKSGKTDKFAALQKTRNAMSENVDANSDQLRRLTVIALHGISGYGLFYSLSQASKAAQLIEGFQFIFEVLENEHRGIRITAVEALVTMLQMQNGSENMTEFTDYVSTAIIGMAKRLGDDYASLYRRKADIVKLVSQLSIFIPKPEVRHSIIKTLLRMWRDPDSEVRVSSIRMMKYMGENGVKEVLDCFSDKSTDSVNIMKELATLINNDEYAEKDILQELLKWRFSLPKLL